MRRPRRACALAFPALALALGACATGPRPFVAEAFAPPRNIAVLPFDNETTDFDGPAFVRTRLNERLRTQKLYPVFNLDSVDVQLRTVGVTEGGQLRTVTAQTLGEVLAADAVMYGTLLEYGGPTTGFVNVRKVKAGFRLVRCADGALLWETEAESAESEGATTGAAALVAGAKALATKAAEKAAQASLATETETMLFEALESLPPARSR